jgi:capsular exopolysaccharide synthesis family protein
MNMAAALAAEGVNVLLVEADLRNPSLRERLKMEATSGLTEMLALPASAVDDSLLPTVEGVRVVVAGAGTANAADLLGSRPMGELMERWKKSFDFVIVDSPPALPVADAQMLATYADVIVLVTRFGRTTLDSLRCTYEEMLPHGSTSQSTAVIGAVLNAVPASSTAYKQYYGHTRFPLSAKSVQHETA